MTRISENLHLFVFLAALPADRFSLSDCAVGTQSCEPNQTAWEPNNVTIFATESPCIRRSRTNRWRIETGLIAQF